MREGSGEGGALQFPRAVQHSGNGGARTLCVSGRRRKSDSQTLQRCEKVIVRWALKVLGTIWEAVCRQTEQKAGFCVACA